MAHKRVISETEYDSHFAEIGKLTESWAQLEYAIDHMIWGMANVHQALGACITSQLMSVNPRMKAFRSLAAALGAGPDSVERIGKLQSKLSGLQTKRNRAVHDPRMMNTNTKCLDRLQITAVSKLEFGWQPETPETLAEIRQEVEDRIREFCALAADVTAEIRSLPEKYRPRLPQMLPLPENQQSPPNE
jgi:hypothetical protein